jgi:hypothetical protein
MLNQLKITSYAFIVALVPFLFLSSQATALPADATSCKGWACEKDGQFCPEGVPGASDASYICDNKKWVELGKPTPSNPTLYDGEADHCKGWECDIKGQVCPMGVPGASDASYMCTCVYVNGTCTKLKWDEISDEDLTAERDGKQRRCVDDPGCEILRFLGNALTRNPRP